MYNFPVTGEFDKQFVVSRTPCLSVFSFDYKIQIWQFTYNTNAHSIEISNIICLEKREKVLLQELNGKLKHFGAEQLTNTQSNLQCLENSILFSSSVCVTITIHSCNVYKITHFCMLTNSTCKKISKSNFSKDMTKMYFYCNIYPIFHEKNIQKLAIDK